MNPSTLTFRDTSEGGELLLLDVAETTDLLRRRGLVVVYAPPPESIDGRPRLTARTERGRRLTAAQLRTFVCGTPTSC